MVAHLTPLEAPIVWLAFAAGIAVGATVTWLMRRRHTGVRNQGD